MLQIFSFPEVILWNICPCVTFSRKWTRTTMEWSPLMSSWRRVRRSPEPNITIPFKWTFNHHLISICCCHAMYNSASLSLPPGWKHHPVHAHVWQRDLRRLVETHTRLPLWPGVDLQFFCHHPKQRVFQVLNNDGPGASGYLPPNLKLQWIVIVIIKYIDRPERGFGCSNVLCRQMQRSSSITSSTDEQITALVSSGNWMMLNMFETISYVLFAISSFYLFIDISTMITKGDVKIMLLIKELIIEIHVLHN